MSVELGTTCGYNGGVKTLFTCGHSTRALDELIGVLKAHGVERLVDVRAFPASRRHPHLARESLERALPAAGIEYGWMGRELGGRRKTTKDSPNSGLRSPGLRAYADYMGTPDFARGLARLLELASEKRTAVMCAELLWWKCHRSLIADYVQLVRGWSVRHIQDAGKLLEHKPKKEARVEGETLVYGQPTLF